MIVVSRPHPADAAPFVGSPWSTHLFYRQYPKGHVMRDARARRAGCVRSSA